MTTRPRPAADDVTGEEDDVEALGIDSSVLSTIAFVLLIVVGAACFFVFGWG